MHALTHPGHAPARVTDFDAPDGTEQLCRVIDGALGRWLATALRRYALLAATRQARDR